MSAAGGTVAGKFVKEANPYEAGLFVSEFSDPTVAAVFVNASTPTLAGKLVDYLYLSSDQTTTMASAKNITLATNAINSVYELGINDAPSIKQGIHQIDNSTYIVKK